ncbi:MAG TPA: porin PorA family protein, partial [Acidimicrobiales bacterium]
VAIEPVTGAQVRVDVNSERFAARPVLTDLPALQGVLGNYPDVPEAVATNEALDELATAPAIPVFEFSYQQTPASIAEVADDVRPMRTQVLLAKVWLPLGLVAVALVSLVIGAAVYLRRGPSGSRVHDMTKPPTAPRPTHEERETVTTGRSAA